MLVNYVRDGLSEETHEFVYVRFSELNNNNGNMPVYLRSCAKPLQASLLIDYGIDSVYDFNSQEIALMCASHAGEECHIEIAKNILRKIGLDESYLKCGIQAPLSRSMQDKMLLKGEKPSQLHNNCSGKHLCFLSICKAKDWDLNTYYSPTHPLQILVKHQIYKLCGINTSNSDVLAKYHTTTHGSLSSLERKSTFSLQNISAEKYPVTTDGCGVPIVSMPLKNMIAGAVKLFCDTRYDKIKNAFLENPYIIGGEDRLDTEVMQKADGLIAKTGAGGLCFVINPKCNDGFVVKVKDASMPARRIAVFNMINRIGWGNIDFETGIKTISGKIVGNIVVEE